jgi:hypothetical protein
MLLAFSGQRPRMVQNVTQCTGKSLHKETILMSIVLRSRNLCLRVEISHPSLANQNFLFKEFEQMVRLVVGRHLEPCHILIMSEKKDELGNRGVPLKAIERY